MFLMNAIDQMTIHSLHTFGWSNDWVLFRLRLLNNNLFPQSLGESVDFIQLLLQLLLLSRY
jgi:hypothetical protein